MIDLNNLHLINLNLAAPIHFMKVDLNSLQHSSNFKMYHFCLENFHCLINHSIFSYWNFRSLLFLYPVTHLRLVLIDHVCNLRRPSFKFRLYQVLKLNWPCTIMKIEPKRLKTQIKNPNFTFFAFVWHFANAIGMSVSNKYYYRSLLPAKTYNLWNLPIKFM